MVDITIDDPIVDITIEPRPSQLLKNIWSYISFSAVLHFILFWQNNCCLFICSKGLVNNQHNFLLNIIHQVVSIKKGLEKIVLKK